MFCRVFRAISLPVSCWHGEAQSPASYKAFTLQLSERLANVSDESPLGPVEAVIIGQRSDGTRVEIRTSPRVPPREITRTDGTIVQVFDSIQVKSSLPRLARP